MRGVVRFDATNPNPAGPSPVMGRLIRNQCLPAAVLSLASSLAQAADAEPVLQLATEAGEWLAAQAAPRAGGMGWPEDAAKPAGVSWSLGSGTAGQVVYFIALYRATGDARFLELAREGGRYLESLLADGAAFSGDARGASLYQGVSGIGVALEILTEHEPRFDASVTRVIELLESRAVSEPTGLRWSDDFNDLLYGDAGTILFVAWRGERAGDLRALEMAARGSHFLASQGEAAETGRYWRFRRGKPFNLPGFSHGTAGVSYVLGTVGDLMDDVALKQAASDGFAYIRSIARVEDGMLSIPYGWPEESWQGLYEFGWAHGLVGASTLFTQLEQLEIAPAEAARFNALALSTMSRIGLPGTPAAPFAEPSTPLDYRFGRAAVLAMLSDHDENPGLRDDLWRVLDTAAIRNAGETHWETDAPDFMGGGRASFTGVLHGTAGIGLALLRLHAALANRPPYVALPDDPAAWAGR